MVNINLRRGQTIIACENGIRHNFIFSTYFSETYYIIASEPRICAGFDA